VEVFRKGAATIRIDPHYVAAACFPREACEPHMILKERQENAGTRRTPEPRGGAPKKKWFGPKDTVLFLVFNGVEAVLGAGVGFTLLKLAALPPKNNYIGRRKLAAVGDRSRGVVGDHLVRLRRPWKCGDAWYPPLYFTVRKWTPKVKRYLTHHVSNRYGWEALFKVLATTCEVRKGAAYEAEQAVKARQRAAAAHARAAKQALDHAADAIWDGGSSADERTAEGRRPKAKTGRKPRAGQ
jgi:hypothetical protein